MQAHSSVLRACKLLKLFITTNKGRSVPPSSTVQSFPKQYFIIRYNRSFGFNLVLKNASPSASGKMFQMRSRIIRSDCNYAYPKPRPSIRRPERHPITREANVVLFPLHLPPSTLPDAATRLTLELRQEEDSTMHSQVCRGITQSVQSCRNNEKYRSSHFTHT
jgi:hypothetical protein